MNVTKHLPLYLEIVFWATLTVTEKKKRSFLSKGLLSPLHKIPKDLLLVPIAEMPLRSTNLQPL